MSLDDYHPPADFFSAQLPIPARLPNDQRTPIVVHQDGPNPKVGPQIEPIDMSSINKNLLSPRYASQPSKIISRALVERANPLWPCCRNQQANYSD